MRESTQRRALQRQNQCGRADSQRIRGLSQRSAHNQPNRRRSRSA